MTGNGTNVIQYITIANTGNATDFGDMLSVVESGGAGSNNSRIVYGGGYGPGVSNIIQYVTIANTGNAIDFGDLTVARMSYVSCASGD